MNILLLKAKSEKGSSITSAVMTTSIHDPNGKCLGGFACEYSGSQTTREVESSLEKSIAGMMERRGYGIVRLE